MNKPSANRSRVKAVSIRNNRQLRDVAFTLRNLFKSGHLGAAEILQEAGNAHEEHRAVLHAGAKQISHNGWSFSDAVSGLFPANIMPAIQAGETAGSIDKVFDQIWQASKAQEEINKVIGQLKTPIAILFVAFLISLVFYIVLVPFVYEGLARNAPPSYDPGFIVNSANAIRSWLDHNWLLTLVGFSGLVIGIAAALAKQENRDAVGIWCVKGLSRFKGIGSAYANLKFGLMARYLEIVSMAGLDMTDRIKLVVGLIPEPLRPGLLAFQKEMLVKGLKDAARAEGRAEGDPRKSIVMWPPYLRLAFSQAHDTGEMDEAMHEYGITMIMDGKERLENYIVTLNRLMLFLGGMAVTIPMGTIYTVMGQIMSLRMQSL
ncbi:hypothetical protein AX279_18345 [Pseudomonas sp. J237]|nr:MULTISPECIES: type II secretion system F family protein [Pseudomonas]OEO24627.1 hypothetical protein AX279_18345 [Pseudomonas sp. J237]CRN72598.1 type IV pilin biogenesis protein [Pseudomonas aeruginosa]